MPSYQPFLISEFKTGIFNYMEPWIRPIDAFDPCQDAFIYRGSLQKRFGYTFIGRMRYRDNVQLFVGDGVANQLFSGTLSKFPIEASSFNGTALTSGGLETFTSNGGGVVTGSLGDTGTINYTTGAWTIQLAGGRSISAGPPAVPFIANYIYSPNQNTTPVVNPIMGLKDYTNENTDVTSLVALDTRRACVYNTSTLVFDPLDSVSQTLWIGDNATTSITFLIQWTGIAPYSVTITDGTNSMTDNGTGGFPGSGNMLNTSTINYATGSVLLNITAANTRTYTITFKLKGDYFSGTTANFFNSTNWLGYLYLTNNVDFITRFTISGSSSLLDRPPIPITQAHKVTFTNDISTCVDIDIYKNRVLIQRPIRVGLSAPDAQSIRFSAIANSITPLNATNFVSDVAGNGGESSAPTDDFMNSSEFLRDQLIVFFQGSVWSFRDTGVQSPPFVWTKINNTKSTNAPYGTIAYDERITAMGAKGLIATDGVNVQRYDIPIIDQFLQIDQSTFKQCFGIRFDPTNQAWMAFPSNGSTVSDRILVYNFLENTWAVYNPYVNMSCFGTFLVTTDATFDSFAVGQPNEATFEQATFPWTYYLNQQAAPDLLGGGQDGNVYLMNDEETDFNGSLEANSQAVSPNITSTRWNPFANLGQKVQFGYIDFYYAVNSNAILTLSFYTDNSENAACTRTLTCSANGTDSNASSPYAMKRIYINAVGEFLRMNIQKYTPLPTESALKGNATFKILGLVLWARPAGRITP